MVFEFSELVSRVDVVVIGDSFFMYLVVVHKWLLVVLFGSIDESWVGFWGSG